MANGFRCFALAKGMIERAVKAEAPWLEGGVWNEVDGEVECRTLESAAGFIFLMDAAANVQRAVEVCELELEW